MTPRPAAVVALAALFLTACALAGAALDKASYVPPGAGTVPLMVLTPPPTVGPTGALVGSQLADAREGVAP